jgi:hypothetical protein
LTQLQVHFVRAHTCLEQRIRFQYPVPVWTYCCRDTRMRLIHLPFIWSSPQSVTLYSHFRVFMSTVMIQWIFRFHKDR